MVEQLFCVCPFRNVYFQICSGCSLSSIHNSKSVDCFPLKVLCYYFHSQRMVGIVGIGLCCRGPLESNASLSLESLCGLKPLSFPVHKNKSTALCLASQTAYLLQILEAMQEAWTSPAKDLVPPEMTSKCQYLPFCREGEVVHSDLYGNPSSLLPVGFLQTFQFLCDYLRTILQKSFLLSLSWWLSGTMSWFFLCLRVFFQRESLDFTVFHLQTICCHALTVSSVFPSYVKLLMVRT